MTTTKFNKWVNRTKILESKGYLLDPTGELVHRKLYIAAHGNIPKNWGVRHLDGDVKNNSLSNLMAMPTRVSQLVNREAKRLGMTITRQGCERIMKAYLNNRQFRTKIEIILVNGDALTIQHKPKERAAPCQGANKALLRA